MLVEIGTLVDFDPRLQRVEGKVSLFGGLFGLGALWESLLVELVFVFENEELLPTSSLGEFPGLFPPINQ